MVTRRPLPATTAANVGSDNLEVPYPITPMSADVDVNVAERDPRRGQPYMTGANPDAGWEATRSEEGLPASLRAGRGRRSMDGEHSGPEDLPESLRVGPQTYTPRSSGELQRPAAESTNPYIRRQQTGQSGSSEGHESSANAWGGLSERPPPPANSPPPPPVPKDDPLEEKFANLSNAEPSTNPWQQSLDAKPLPEHPKLQTEDPWASILVPPSRPAPQVAQPSPLIDLPSDESPAWDENEAPSKTSISPYSDLEVVQPEPVEENAWKDSDAEAQRRQATAEYGNTAPEEYPQNEDGWESEMQPQESGIIENPPQLPARSEERAPALPRRPDDVPPARPPRPSASVGDSASSLTGPGTAAKQQKKETYEIKKVSWYDASSSSNPRISPILVQNANGPCPLLALVNALTLSTPAEVNTALVETLRSREQVSLGLLLDAVFDELMSGRRGDVAQELPDVGDLYAFLITLHTGMNVNPRFFPPAPTNLLDDPRRSMSHVHPVEREEVIPGTFEDTREMKLYSTFSVPLIHGWLPPRGSPAHAALSRSAKTYEDAQNLMFREEELEDKLQREGLSFEEQATLEDIATIKSFFVESATQLTPYGLETITKSMAPGSLAILFRNDHFSTLYRHPESYQLLHLVTDMGYAGHEEVVWESLVDVNGENCEFFSGDFRIVGDAPAETRPSNDEAEWTTASGRGNQSQNSQSRNSLPVQHDAFAPPPMSPNTEQEDHDLALALQLQDEEEQRHQAEVARRRRESELSQQFIEQQGTQSSGIQVPVTNRGGGGGGGRGTRTAPRNRGGSRDTTEHRPSIPPRRNNTNPPTPVPAPLPVNDPEAGVDAPPPSYEQAATQPSYIPPVNHPAHPSAAVDDPTPPPAQQRHRRVSSAYAATAAALQNPQARPVAAPVRSGRAGGRVNSTGPGRSGGLVSEAQNSRRQQTGVAPQQQEREKDCVIM